MLGQVYVRQRRLEEARREFTALGSKQSKPVAATTMIGLIYQMEGNVPAAKASFEKAVALDPNAAVAANNLAWLYAEAGEKLDIALQLARSAVANLPDSPEASDTLGWVYYQKALPDLAIAPFEQAIERDAKNAMYHYHLGLACAKAGDTARAKVELERALAIRSDSDWAETARRVLTELRP
jgi:tetratricopeptide (TPR) repeat protein